MTTRGRVDVLSPRELDMIVDRGRRVLAEVGVKVENGELLSLLGDCGAEVSMADQRARLPGRVVDDLLAGSRPEYADAEGVENSCLFPYGRRAEYANGLECTAGCYPTDWLDLDGEVRRHTRRSVAAMTRLADALDDIDRLGSMGVPSDVPAPLAPLHQRFLAWRHACRKRSNCGEVRDRRLIPYVVEMGGVMAESRGESPRAWTYAEVELISPLRFAAEEAATFVEFWRRGLLCGVGFMHSAGGSAPATLAGVLALNCAENLFINLLYRLCYGWRKLWFQTNASVLDMRCGMFPFGRPERGLMTLAVGQVARHLDAGLWASAIYPDAKGLTCEAGLQSAFNVTPAILAGTLGIESFGLLSGGEMNSPLQLIIENEFAAGLKRFARGFEVTEETLALDVIREVGAGGMFLDTDHTLRHFRQEHWQPALFSRQPLNAWLASGRKTDVEAAREIWQFAQRAHDIPGMPDDAERRLLGIMEKAGRDLL